MAVKGSSRSSYVLGILLHRVCGDCQAGGRVVFSSNRTACVKLFTECKANEGQDPARHRGASSLQYYGSIALSVMCKLWAVICRYEFDKLLLIDVPKTGLVWTSGYFEWIWYPILFPCRLVARQRGPREKYTGSCTAKPVMLCMPQHLNQS
eukprot:866412-Pleurochrysis_carterae.AAC.1